MKSLPVYQNLDTSFINLSALIRYLREQSFVGRVQIRLRGGYEAEITFGAEDQFTVLEHDRVAGRIAEGDEALQRILIRAKNGEGKINVFKPVETDEPVSKELKLPTYVPISKPLDKPFSEKEIIPESPEKAIAPALPARNGNGHQKADFRDIPVKRPANDFLNLLPENHAPLPLEFTNRVESRARDTRIPTGEWQTLLRLTGELCAAVENVLENSNLNFSKMLMRARAEIADDYPFLNPSSGVFYYSNGKAEMSEQVSTKIFAASLNEILRRILERLADNPHLAEAHRDATQKILALVHQNQKLYDKFFITPRLKKILGV